MSISALPWAVAAEIRRAAAGGHATPEPSDGLRGRVLAARRRLRANRGGDDESGLGFAVRMLVTLVLTFALIGGVGLTLLGRKLAAQQTAEYAVTARSDAAAFEALSSRARSPADGLLDINRLLQGATGRRGVLESLLIDRNHSIAAAGGVNATPAFVGTTSVDPRVSAALANATPYAGREADPAQDPRDTEFVVPLSLFGVRYAYTTTYDHSFYADRQSEVTTILALIGLIGLFGGSIAFYLVGGRRLIREHRMVLRRATRDGLTDLPNQRAFQDEFAQAVAAAERHREPLSLAVLDIDGFKRVNDRHGHPHGDAVLKCVARVLRDARPADRPYRIGGDEFAMLMERTDAAGSRAVARRLTTELAGEGVEMSIGLSVLQPGLTTDSLRAEADAALYEAKREGGNRMAHFDDIGARVDVITADKKDAVLHLISEGRVDTVFQPIWNLGTGNLLGLEALTRPDPRYGLSGPAEAFDIAEQLGRVHQLDELCVERALRAGKDLAPGLLLFINLSPVTLDLDADANAWLAPLVGRAGLSPEQVVVEVTERFGGHIEAVVRRIQRLRRQGFKIAVDDVGTGNSGLEMLGKVDAELVKLDRSIILAAATEPSAHAILMAMVTFACETGAFVIAEGIEDASTLDFLRRLDGRPDPSRRALVHGGQGFGLGRPSRDLLPPTPGLLRSCDWTARPLEDRAAERSRALTMPHDTPARAPLALLERQSAR